MPPKFIKEDDTSRFFDSYLCNEFQNKFVKREIESIETSHLTECPRRLCYAASGEKEESTKTRLEELAQEFARKKFASMLGKNGLMKIVGESVEVSDCNYNLIGRIDIALKHKTVLYLVQVYSLSSAKFQHILEEGPSRKHIVEVIMNHWLAEQGEPIIIYENRDTGDYKIYHVLPYKPIIDSAKAKSLELINGKLTGEIPDKPYDNAKALECIDCEYRNLCW